MTDRRPMGALAADILAALWAANGSSTPGDVLDAIGGDVTYSTVTTILTRLRSKGLVERERRGRVFVYRPTVSAADLAATRMHEQLAVTPDREAVLSRFVGTLSRKDERILRRVLGGLDQR